MHTLSPQIEAARRMMHSDQAWIWLVEIESVDAGKFFRLAGAGKHVTANGKLWQACTLDVQPPSESGDGSSGEASITIPNVSRLPIAFVESGDILGQSLTLTLAHESVFDDLVGCPSWRLRVLRTRIDAAAAIFDLGGPAEIERIPSRVMDRFAFPQLLPTGRRRLST